MGTSINFNEKKGFICDMDGVIYHGNRILPGVAEFIQWLHEENKEYLFLTNNSGYTPRELNQKLARMGLGSGRQGNVALDLNDGAVERKLAQGTRHGVAIEPQLFAHLGQRRCIETGFVQQGNDTFAGLSHHTRRGGSGVRVEHLGALGSTHAARAALGNQSRGNAFISGRPRSMGNGAGRKSRLLGSRRVHG